MLVEKLAALGAPMEMREWAADKSFLEVWQECDRGDWLIAILAASPLDGKLLTLAALDCAMPCVKYVKGGDYALKNAGICAQNWAAGLGNLDIVRLAIQQAGDEEQKALMTVAALREPQTRALTGMARYAIRSASHSAIARGDAQNAVYAAAECCRGGAEQDTSLDESAKRIRERVGYEAARAALGL